MKSLKTLIASGVIAISSILPTFGQVPQSINTNKNWAYEKLGTSYNADKSDKSRPKVKVAVFDESFGDVKGKKAPSAVKTINRSNSHAHHGDHVAEIITNVASNADILICEHVPNLRTTKGVKKMLNEVGKTLSNMGVDKNQVEKIIANQPLAAIHADIFAKNVDFAIANKVKVINFSAVVGNAMCTYPELRTVYKHALNKAFKSDISVVASSGNKGLDLDTAATNNRNISLAELDERVISVGSVDGYHNLSPFSNFGSSIDITAYGQGIYSNEKQGNSIDGTSFSAPMVTGALVRIATDNPTWTREQREARLFEFALDVGEQGKDVKFGHGVLNLTNYPLTEKEFVEKVFGDFSIEEDKNENSIRGQLHEIKANNDTIAPKLEIKPPTP